MAFDHDSDSGDLTITHDGGDGVAAEELALTGDLDADGDNTWSGYGDYGDGSQITAGDRVVVEGTDLANANDKFAWDANEGDTVRVVWRGDGSQSSTLRSYTVD